MRIKWLFIFILFIFACRENEDENPPQITFLTPEENARVQIGDSILVQASIFDDERIETIRLSLINLNSKVALGGSKSIQALGKSYELNELFTLSNLQMDAGAYYFELVARDQDNVSTAFRNVFVDQIPRRLKGLLVITENNGTLSVQVQEQDSTTEIARLSSSLKAGVLNNLYQQLWIIPSGQNDVQIIDLIGEDPILTIAAPLSIQADAFGEAELNEHLVYLSDYSGLVQAYQPNLSDRFTYVSPGQTYVETFDVFQDRIFIAEQGNGISGTLLSSIWKASGGLIESANLNKSVNEITVLSEDRALLCSNHQGNTVLEEFFFFNASLVPLANIPNDQIEESVKITDNDFILASQQAVYRFNYQWKSIDTLMSGSIRSMIYDESQGEFIVAHDNAVSIFNASTFQLVSSIQFANEQTVFAAYWYNR